MTTTHKTAEVLNDLIKINNDRIEGYERALKETDALDLDLKGLFNHFSSQSKGFNDDLTYLVERLPDNEKPASGATALGALHRAWMDVKATFTGHDRKGILEECERGEDAAKKAYKDALAESSVLGEVRKVIEEQAARQKEAHDEVKKLRDSQ